MNIISTTLQLSWSLLESYNQCPLKFYKKYILKEKEPTNIFALYGCAFHVLLNNLYENEKFISKYAYAIWNDVLQKEYNLPSKKRQYCNLTQTQVDSIKFLGFQQIKYFFELATTESLLKPALFTEKEIKGSYRGHKLVCKIDLGLNTKRGRTLIDWKTGEPNPKDFYQLVLYASLAEKKLGKKIEAVALVYIKTKEMCYKELTEELRQEAGKYVGDIYNSMISDEKFEPKKNKYCKYCFINTCIHHK